MGKCFGHRFLYLIKFRIEIYQVKPSMQVLCVMVIQFLSENSDFFWPICMRMVANQWRMSVDCLKIIQLKNVQLEWRPFDPLVKK